jgi:hypothetical protein
MERRPLVGSALLARVAALVCVQSLLYSRHGREARKPAQGAHMKSLSSAIVAAAGVLCFATGGLIPHDDTQQFVMLVGAVVGLLGLVAWGLSIFRPTDPPAEDKITPARKPFQFGLASLFVLLAIVAILLAIPAAQEQRARERQAQQSTRKLKQIGDQFQRLPNRSPD